MSSPHKCCVRYCTTTREHCNTILHSFPNPVNEEGRFRTWLNLIGGNILVLDSKSVFNNRKVCHKHFETKYHTRSSRLSANAVPSLQLKGSRADVPTQSEPCIPTSALTSCTSEQYVDEPEVSDNDQSTSGDPLHFLQESLDEFDNLIPTPCVSTSTTPKLTLEKLQEYIIEQPLSVNINEKAISEDSLQHTKSIVSVHMPVVSKIQLSTSGDSPKVSCVRLLDHKTTSCSSNSKKKDPNSVKSFHAFPSNPKLKIKWLKAIGRPNWLPPSHSRVCNAHFDTDQINYEGQRIRVKDDAFPVKSLPLNSNFEASNVEVCRICLATNMKMYSLQDTHLGTCLDSIVGLNQLSNIDGLPKYVCCQCAPWLIKCNKLIEKCMMSQTILLDIFAKNGQITTSLIEKNKADSNTKASSDDCKNDDVNHTTHFMTKLDTAKRKGIIIKNKDEINMETEMQDVETLNYEIETLEKEFKATNYEISCDADKEESIINIHDGNDISDNNLNEDLSATENNEKSNQQNHNEKQLVEKNFEVLTPNEKYMMKHFNIVKLSLNGQIKEWEKSMARRPLTSEIIYQCEICNKMFANERPYRTHVTYHDPSHGANQCPVCKLRFKDSALAMYHVKRAHSCKYYCKTCPKTFNNADAAKKHARLHSDYVYKCDMCSFSALHESKLSAHRRVYGHTHTCALCGRALNTRRGLEIHTRVAHIDKDVDISKEYRCEQCNIDFASEGARRVHILTSVQHKKKPGLCDTTAQESTLRNCCKKCGIQCSSFKELVLHMRAEHHRQQRDIRTPYPISCEICGETIGNRMKHWQHVRRLHPNNMDSYQQYQPVICAVCDVCGKGFQNATKLSLHQLRHRRPAVACPQCPRVFYDKYALGRHARTHSALRPYACRTCGRAFKLLSNLERHAGVHTDLTPYGCSLCDKKFKYSSSVNLHVRTVHYKLPHPPRKRSKIAVDASD